MTSYDTESKLTWIEGAATAICQTGGSQTWFNPRSSTSTVNDIAFQPGLLCQTTFIFWLHHACHIRFRILCTQSNRTRHNKRTRLFIGGVDFGLKIISIVTFETHSTTKTPSRI